MSSPEKPAAAFVLSLLAGFMILFGGAMIGVVGDYVIKFVPAFIAKFLPLLVTVRILSGVAVIAAAVLLFLNPAQTKLWGVFTLVVSVINLVMIGVLGGAGSVLGIIGGALALSWKPTAG